MFHCFWIQICIREIIATVASLLKDEDIQAATANDGTLPGGMNPETFKKLIADEKVMELLQSTKMQEAMKLMMSGGREELTERLKEDEELREVVSQLDAVMKNLQ